MKKISLIALAALMAAACNGYDGPAPDSHLVLEGWIDSGGQPRILALSTCSDEFTDARTIVLTLID